MKLSISKALINKKLWKFIGENELQFTEMTISHNMQPRLIPNFPKKFCQETAFKSQGSNENICNSSSFYLELSFIFEKYF